MDDLELGRRSIWFAATGVASREGSHRRLVGGSCTGPGILTRQDGLYLNQTQSNLLPWPDARMKNLNQTRPPLQTHLVFGPPLVPGAIVEYTNHPDVHHFRLVRIILQILRLPGVLMSDLADSGKIITTR